MLCLRVVLGSPGCSNIRGELTPLKASCSPLASLHYCQLENTLLILFTRYLFIWPYFIHSCIYSFTKKEQFGKIALSDAFKELLLSNLRAGCWKHLRATDLLIRLGYYQRAKELLFHYDNKTHFNQFLNTVIHSIRCISLSLGFKKIWICANRLVLKWHVQVIFDYMWHSPIFSFLEFFFSGTIKIFEWSRPVVWILYR